MLRMRRKGVSKQGGLRSVKGDDDVGLLRQDLIEQIGTLYKTPLPMYRGSGSSIGLRGGVLYKHPTLQAVVGGASGAATTPRMKQGAWSGTAASATSSMPPNWVQLKFPTSGNFKAHLMPEDTTFPVTLCGKEGNFVPAFKPKVARMCKRCVGVFRNNVMEGRYAR